MGVKLDSQDLPDVRAIDRASLSVRASPDVTAPDFAVVVPAAAWSAMQEHAHTRLDVEVGGVLVGRPFLSETGAPYLHIEAIIPALAAESRQTNITFTGEAWAKIHETIDCDHPTAAIVGWYHTHPAFGIFLSEMDTFICRHFFDLPHQVAIVIDPVAKSHGCFIWHAGVPTLGPMMIEGAAAALDPRHTTAVTEIQQQPEEGPRESANTDLRPDTSARTASRLDRTQWVALLGLLALAAAVFGALVMMWLDLSPSEAIGRVRDLLSLHGGECL